MPLTKLLGDTKYSIPVNIPRYTIGPRKLFPRISSLLKTFSYALVGPITGSAPPPAPSATLVPTSPTPSTSVIIPQKIQELETIEVGGSSTPPPPKPAEPEEFMGCEYRQRVPFKLFGYGPFGDTYQTKVKPKSHPYIFNKLAKTQLDEVSIPRTKGPYQIPKMGHTRGYGRPRFSIIKLREN
jgi:hypothetical protein